MWPQIWHHFGLLFVSFLLKNWFRNLHFLAIFKFQVDGWYFVATFSKNWANFFPQLGHFCDLLKRGSSPKLASFLATFSYHFYLKTDFKTCNFWLFLSFKWIFVDVLDFQIQLFKLECLLD
jgi:hypothetical protein